MKKVKAFFNKALVYFDTPMQYPYLHSTIRYISALMIVLALGFFASCDDGDDYYLGSTDAPNSGSTSGDGGNASHRLELPLPLAGNDLLEHRTKVGGRDIVNYTIEYDRAAYHSRWVAFRFDAQTRAKAVSRKDYSIRPQYPHDPLLPQSVGLENDARFNGYDHGHLVASADRLFSREGNDQTFYITNMSPMNGNFNQKYWVTLEQFVQDKGRDASFADTLYVAKGGTIADNMISGRVSSGRIVVPKYYYMALLKVKNGVYSALGLWVEHKNYGTSYAPRSILRSHAVSIDQLETLTGINFFHNLPDRVENVVESEAFLSAWGIS